MRAHTITTVLFSALLFASTGNQSLAITYYVDINSATPVAPYTNWLTAAVNIQDAVNEAEYSGTVLVSNGIYSVTLPVFVEGDIIVQSVNGPDVTVVDGGGATQCFIVNGPCTIGGMTITNGYSSSQGGGIYCASSYPIITNCIIIGNSASYGGGMFMGTAIDCVISGNSASDYGGGLFDGMASNSTIFSNSASSGGGMYYGTATNCTISGNAALFDAGGAYRSELYNCSIFDNEAARTGGGVQSCSLWNCTVVRNHASWGGGSASWGALKYIYNSIIAGNSSGAWDEIKDVGGGPYAIYNSCAPGLIHGIDGNITNAPKMASVTYLSPNSPCFGAGEFTNSVGVDIDGLPWLNPPSMGCDEFHGVGSVTGSMSVAISGPDQIVIGHPAVFISDVQGPAYQHTWDFGDGSYATNNLQPTHTWGSTGVYDVVLTAYNATYSGGISATQPVTVVTAEEAVIYVALTGNDANDGTSWTQAKQTIQAGVDALVFSGGTVLVSNGNYSLFSEISVDKSCAIKSVAGPEHTIVDGNGYFRCFDLNAPNVIVSGFTVTNGYTTGRGGGIRCRYDTDRIINCIISGNRAHGGGGVNCGSISNSIVQSNESSYSGGGLQDSQAYHSVIAGNRADRRGGGAHNPYLRNCLVYANEATDAGGVNGGSLYNSTVAGNHAYNEAGGFWMWDRSHLQSSIVWGNSVFSSISDVSGPGLAEAIIRNSCASELTEGVDGNISSEPLFADEAAGDYHLSSTSPCINWGNNADVADTVDIDGNPRIIDGNVDIGAYEAFFITDSHAAASGFILEWMIPATGWSSVVTYSTNLTEMPYTDLSSGMAYPVNAYTDTVYGAEGQCFYRVEMVP